MRTLPDVYLENGRIDTSSWTDACFKDFAEEVEKEYAQEKLKSWAKKVMYQSWLQDQKHVRIIK